MKALYTILITGVVCFLACESNNEYAQEEEVQVQQASQAEEIQPSSGLVPDRQ